MKMMLETKKILEDATIQVTATAVRVPVMGGHSESINVSFKNEFDLSEVRKALEQFPGIKVVDDIQNAQYPMPNIHAHDSDEVFVGRLRRDDTMPYTLNAWVVSDNLRKGAATNAVQIAEYIFTR
jgi:aspartate-semialdehyde dehydrogenase